MLRQRVLTARRHCDQAGPGHERPGLPCIDEIFAFPPHILALGSFLWRLERVIWARRPPGASAHVVVLGNEKGGSGKSTTAMHIIVALLKSGRRVASVDTDSRQRSLTRILEIGRAGRAAGTWLEMPTHFVVTLGAGRGDPRDRGTGVHRLCRDHRPDPVRLRLHRRRYRGERLVSDAPQPFDGRYAGDADQRQLRRLGRSRAGRSGQLCRYRAGHYAELVVAARQRAPPCRRPRHGLGRRAQPAGAAGQPQ